MKQFVREAGSEALAKISLIKIRGIRDGGTP
jgi:hypothetical protein